MAKGQGSRLDRGLPRQDCLLSLSAHMVRVQAAQPVERQTGLSLSEEVMAKAKANAEAEGRSLSNYIARDLAPPP